MRRGAATDRVDRGPPGGPRPARRRLLDPHWALRRPVPGAGRHPPRRSLVLRGRDQPRVPTQPDGRESLRGRGGPDGPPPVRRGWHSDWGEADRDLQRREHRRVGKVGLTGRESASPTSRRCHPASMSWRTDGVPADPSWIAGRPATAMAVSSPPRWPGPRPADSGSCRAPCRPVQPGARETGPSASSTTWRRGTSSPGSPSAAGTEVGRRRRMHREAPAGGRSRESPSLAW